MSDCSCIWVPDYDPADFYAAKTVTARKVHKCSECKRDIETDEKYERATGMWDHEPGTIRTFKTCADCSSVFASFFCDGWLHEGLWEMLEDHIKELNGEIKSSCLAPLTPRAREMVCELIEEAWAKTDWEDDDE